MDQIKEMVITEKEGYQKNYHNGWLESEGYYVNGEKVGYWKRYDSNKQLRSEGHYVNGKREGLWKDYYPDGKLESEGYYVNGKREGYWKFYHYRGGLEQKRYYTNGEYKFSTEYSRGYLTLISFKIDKDTIFTFDCSTTRRFIRNDATSPKTDPGEKIFPGTKLR